jgi:hypothetical protein
MLPVLFACRGAGESMTTIVKVTDTSTRAEIADVLAEANYQAKRKPHVLGVVGPSAWDEAHSLIDCLLQDWLDAPA